MTKKELLAKLKALGKIDKDKRKEIICTLIGHSRIVSLCFDYVTCARCDKQIGDSLAGIFDLTDKVIVGHACKTCDANRETLTWKDKFEVDAEEAK